MLHKVPIPTTPYLNHQAFHAQDRIHTSRPWARKMGLQDRVLPFALVLFLATSMTHADSAKVQVGFGRVAYLWPAFAGDTVTKSFTVKSIRNTSDGHHSVRTISHCYNSPNCKVPTASYLSCSYCCHCYYCHYCNHYNY